MEMIDEATDYAFDIQGWLEDCLDEIDMREENETLLKMCNDLLELFDWTEYTGSDIKFRKSTVLCRLGRVKAAVDFCQKWIKKEPENIVAATAASKLYEVMGKKKEKKEVDKSIKKYDEYLEEYFLNSDFDEEDDLPFD